MRNIKYILLSLAIVGCLSCKKQFDQAITSPVTNFLSVEGPILSGDSTIITLSRTTSLKDTTLFKAELKAIVSIENDQNKLYPLAETTKGNYVLGVTNFDAARKYRLNIKTANGKVYQSDFVPLKITPPIDSVYWTYPNYDRMEFFVDTHDASNKTRYYRWDYKEVWQYFSWAYNSAATTSPNLFDYVNGNIAPRNPPVNATVCYASDISNQILISSSAKLANDIIKRQRIGAIVSQSQKLEKLYNMQLRQYALTEDGFNYYQNLKTNTEQLGTIFDTQPSLTKGNIHCITSPNESVIGFVSASTLSIRMVFIRYNEIPLRIDDLGLVNNPMYIAPPFPSECKTEMGPNIYEGIILYEPAVTFDSRLKSYLSGGATPYFTIMITGYSYPNGNKSLPPNGLTWYRKDCIDCRFNNHEGSSVTFTRPSYFPPY